MPINSLDTLFPPFAELVTKCAKDAQALGFYAFETYRSLDTQMEYFKRGRSYQGGLWVVTDPKAVVTKAKPGFSFHAYGLAVDMVPKVEGATPKLGLQWSWDDYDLKTAGKQPVPWTKLAAIYRKYGLLAGNDWKKFPDPPHGEKSYGFKVIDLYSILSKEGLPAVWKKIEASISKKTTAVPVVVAIPALPAEIAKPQSAIHVMTDDDVVPQDAPFKAEDVQLGYFGRFWRDAMGGSKA